MTIDARAANESRGKCLTEIGLRPIPLKAGPLPPRCIQDLRDNKRYVYFVGGAGTPVKIGISTAPYERLASLQAAHWIRLEILALVPGGAAARSPPPCAFQGMQA